MTPRTSDRASADVDCQRELIGDLTEHDLGIDVFHLLDLFGVVSLEGFDVTVFVKIVHGAEESDYPRPLTHRGAAFRTDIERSLDYVLAALVGALAVGDVEVIALIEFLKIDKEIRNGQ